MSADEFDPLNRDYVLSAEAQERRDAFDAAAFDTEYRGYRDEIRSEPDDEGTIEADGGTVTVESTGANTSTTVNGEDARPIGVRTPGTNMRSRRDMSWSYLDRNSDGQLTVAEYAIWAIPLTPEAGEEVDISEDQAERLADSFYYYDQDGDGELSQREFTSARRGDDIG